MHAWALFFPEMISINSIVGFLVEVVFFLLWGGGGGLAGTRVELAGTV